MKNKKTGFLSLVLAMTGFSLSSTAQSNDVKTIQVFQGENSMPSYEYALDDTKSIFFGTDEFTFTFYSSSDTSFKFDEVRSIKFGNGVPSSVQAVETNDDDIMLSYSGGILTVGGCDNQSVLTVYDITGRTVLSRKVNGSAEISLSSLAAGIYIANINNTTIKFSI